jgi:hypothetical protein
MPASAHLMPASAHLEPTAARQTLQEPALLLVLLLLLWYGVTLWRAVLSAVRRGRAK